jgi:hypothetical protein
MSLRERAIRVHIERLLSKNENPHEIANVFADLRFLKGCPLEVRDLADFAAHRPERNRGRLLDKTSQLYKQLRLHMQGKAPLNVQAGYTDVQIAKALVSFCVTNGIFKSSELKDISKLITPIALYGLVSIHGCVFEEMDGSKQTPLTIRSSNGRLEIGCTVPSMTYGVTHPQTSQIFINMPAFATSLAVSRTVGRLNSDLVLQNSRSTRDTSIEIADDLHLRYLE